MSLKDIKVDKNLFKLRQIDLENVDMIEGESITFWQDAFRRVKKNRYALVAFWIISIIVFMAIFGPYFNKYTYDKRVMSSKTESIKIPPRVRVLEHVPFLPFDGTIVRDLPVVALEDMNDEYYEVIKYFDKHDQDYVQIRHDVYADRGIKDKYFWLGTDDLGRDQWTRLWYGARISLYIGLLAAFMDLSLGVIYGGIAGYFGGTKIDNLMMRFTEVIGGIPSLVILMLLLMVMEPGLISLSIAIAATGWIGVARVVRAQYLKLKDQEFVLASRTLGANPRRIIIKHLFPNVIGQIIIMITFSIPGAIFYEAFLAFIGLGIPAPLPSMGTLINNGYKFMTTNPYMMWLPTIVLSILMLSINLLANGLRDALDPKMRGK